MLLASLLYSVIPPTPHPPDGPTPWLPKVSAAPCCLTHTRSTLQKPSQANHGGWPAVVSIPRTGAGGVQSLPAPGGRCHLLLRGRPGRHVITAATSPKKEANIILLQQDGDAARRGRSPAPRWRLVLPPSACPGDLQLLLVKLSCRGRHSPFLAWWRRTTNLLEYLVQSLLFGLRNYWCWMIPDFCFLPWLVANGKTVCHFGGSSSTHDGRTDRAKNLVCDINYPKCV